jgi:putative colanic acid biosynthesis UDP-glucose lipid carrier transferase
MVDRAFTSQTSRESTVTSRRAVLTVVRPLGFPSSVRSTDPTAPAIRTDEPSGYLLSRRKRLLDVSLAGALLLGLLPLLLMVALIIRTTSKGPILFRQTRCGAGGKPFVIYKFRSMKAVEASDTLVVQATRDDARITTIGRFIRRTSIDELPQLVNVLQGDMSLIGPRPHATSHDAFYASRIPRYNERFFTKPGLSGLAQVSGARGETPQISDMARRIEFDLNYIQTANLRQDIKVIAATVREMMFSSSAY